MTIMTDIQQFKRRLLDLEARVLARTDRAIKGRLQANSWDEMALLAVDLCGVRLPLVRRT